jgi:hypothetical protein
VVGAKETKIEAITKIDVVDGALGSHGVPRGAPAWVISALIVALIGVQLHPCAYIGQHAVDRLMVLTFIKDK